MNSLPYIKYIQTLLLGRVSYPHILKKLEDVNISLTSSNILELVERDLKMDYPGHYAKSKPPMDIEILKDLDIVSMYGYVFDISFPEGYDGIKGSFKIQNDPQMHKLVTSLCMAKITPEDIDLIANGKSSEYSSEDITQFVHYFFNVSDWTLREKETYIHNLPQEDLRRFYKIALKNDKDYLLWKLGAAPDKPFDEMLKEMAVDSYYNFKERTKYDPELAQRWGQLVVKLTEKLEKLDKDTRDKKNMFDEIVFSLSRDKEKSKKSNSRIKEIPHISHLKENIVNG